MEENVIRFLMNAVSLIIKTTSVMLVIKDITLITIMFVKKLTSCARQVIKKEIV